MDQSGVLSGGLSGREVVKKLILGSIFCLALRAQEKAPPLAPDQLIDPADPFGFMKRPPGSLALTFKLNEPIPSGVCSMPLLEAHVNTELDPRIAISLPDNSAPIPQVRVPAAACAKQ